MSIGVARGDSALSIAYSSLDRADGTLTGVLQSYGCDREKAPAASGEIMPRTPGIPWRDNQITRARPGTAAVCVRRNGVVADRATAKATTSRCGSKGCWRSAP